MFFRRIRRYLSETLENDEWLTDRKADSSFSLLSPKRHLYAEEYDLKKLEDVQLESVGGEPPRLLKGLDKIIREDGIFPADQFPEDLRHAPPISDEVYSRIQSYKKPSVDPALYQTTLKCGAKYLTGSSSLTEALQQIYYSISNFKSPDVTGLGMNYDHLNMNYMSAYRKPTTFFLKKLPGNIYAIDSDKGPVINQELKVLLQGGLIMESKFTMPPDLFARICDLSTPLSPQDQDLISNFSKAYKFRKIGNILVRSQIDTGAIDENGNPFVFEIKTRACAPIRYDLENYQNYLDYKIDRRNGLYSSYEREYFDLVRSILLKYFFQIKIGRMDGAFMAYHNTYEIFGFEYLKLQEIEKRLFGSPEISEQILKICIAMFQDIIDEVIEKFPDDEYIKVGLFANYRSDELMITIEAHEKEFEYPSNPDVVKYIKDEVDFYNGFFPGKTAYTICRRIFPYINGILQREPVFLESGDKLTFKQIRYNKGLMKFQDYMYFLHHAYKLDSLTYHKEFIGIWKKYNDFHIYRKPIYRNLE